MDPRFVAIGAVFTTEQRLAHLAQGVARGAAGAARSAVAPAVTVATTVAVVVTPASVRRTVGDAVRQLDEQGRAAVTSTAADAERVIEALADRLSREPALLNFVDRMVEHLLPVVLERLAAEPDQLREIVQGQSRGVADELTQAARSRAVAGDEAVDRFLTRVFRRRTVSNGAAARDREGADVLQPDGGVVPPDGGVVPASGDVLPADGDVAEP
jgi:hypothetical protein